ncbi:hypothetical protein CRYUN_Cryun08bG0064300 [Craigia yunnanensis]
MGSKSNFLANLLQTCIKKNSSLPGRQVHSQIVKDGYENDVFVGTALVDMYCKCGDIDGARKYFDMMPVRNTVTWNEMLDGYAQNGRGDVAVHLYQDMIASGGKPHGITFIAVLTAFSHSGLVDLGVRIFNSMQSDHRLEPEFDQYTCIIDCLGRPGHFHDAELLVDKMPYKDDPIEYGMMRAVRELMSDKQIVKDPGYSWTEDKEQDTSLFVG